MNTILELLFTLTIAGSAVVACILVLRLISMNAISAKWRYGISKLAVAFYLLPIILGIQWLSPLIPYNAAANAPIVNESFSTTSYALTGQYSGFNPDQLNQGYTITANVALPIICLWAIGAIAFIAWQMYCYRRFAKNLEYSKAAVPNHSEAGKLLSIVKEDLGISSNVRLAYSSIIRSPVLVGLWKPTIYLPIGNMDNLDMVIRHELIHLKRKDLWVKAFTLGASALHWFNPLVHMLRKDIHIWSEFSCDEQVVQEMSYAERKRYGETILSVMAGSRNVPVQFCASLSGEGKQLKRRLMFMLSVKKLKKKTQYLTLAAVFLVAAISTTAAAWASNHTPKVVEHGESHSEAQPAPAETSPRLVEVEPATAEPSLRLEEAQPVPAEASSRLEEAQPVPAEISPRLIEGEPAPAEISPRLVEVEPVPAEASSRLEEAQPVPAEISPRLIEGEPAPAEISPLP